MRETGVKVANITCDSPRVNISMMNKLGANINADSIETQVLQHIDEEPPVHVIHDMAHTAKNVRNAWHHHNILVNSEGQRISWAYIVKLHELQSREQLRCANKLSDKHVYFQNQKMKVHLATQLFSNSVAKSLKFCREVLNHPDFEGSEATEEFIKIMNDCFDVFNSKSPRQILLQGPMSEENKHIWMPFLDKTTNYVSGLTNQNGDSMVKKDSRKTGFLAILCNIVAVKEIYLNVVVNGPLSYLLTYKLSQDHLEHFFGLVRVRFGCNNNPTPLQFRHLYRRILLGVTNAIVTHSNVLLQDESEIVALIPTPEDRIAYILEEYDLGDIDLEELSDTMLSEYKQSVIEYITGYVVMKLSRKINCDHCNVQLRAKSPTKQNFIGVKDYGPENVRFLTYPSNLVTQISETCEKVILYEIENGNWLTKKFFLDFLTIKIIRVLVDIHKDIYSKLDDHGYELVKKIIICYCCIRLKHHAHLVNEKLKKSGLRTLLSKTVIQNNL